jgi:hypothetical protein
MCITTYPAGRWDTNASNTAAATHISTLGFVAIRILGRGLRRRPVTIGFRMRLVLAFRTRPEDDTSYRPVDTAIGNQISEFVSIPITLSNLRNWDHDLLHMPRVGPVPMTVVLT